MDLKNGMVIRCNSKEEAKEFIKEAYKQGFEWVNHIDGCEEKTCWYTGSSEIYYYLESNKITWSTRDFENESIEYSTLKEKIKTMTKSDLKNGMVVELRNGNRFLVHNDKLLNFEGYVNINDSFAHMFYYNEDLTRSYDKEFDIIRIYESDAFCLKDIFKDRFLNIIWERKEDKQELSKKDKKVIKKGLAKAREYCKTHLVCDKCELYDNNGDCFLDRVPAHIEIDKLFKD